LPRRAHLGQAHCVDAVITETVSLKVKFPAPRAQLLVHPAAAT
jgi:hypothetical protein